MNRAVLNQNTLLPGKDHDQEYLLGLLVSKQSLLLFLDLYKTKTIVML